MAILAMNTPNARTEKDCQMLAPDKKVTKNYRDITRSLPDGSVLFDRWAVGDALDVQPIELGGEIDTGLFDEHSSIWLEVALANQVRSLQMPARAVAVPSNAHRSAMRV